MSDNGGDVILAMFQSTVFEQGEVVGAVGRGMLADFVEFGFGGGVLGLKVLESGLKLRKERGGGGWRGQGEPCDLGREFPDAAAEGANEGASVEEAS